MESIGIPLGIYSISNTNNTNILILIIIRIIPVIIILILLILIIIILLLIIPPACLTLHLPMRRSMRKSQEKCDLLISMAKNPCLEP
jgi:hypothetical protein